MTNSIGTFFWLSFIFMFVKLKTDMPKHGYVLFFLVIVIFMYFINVTILQERCGNVRSITVLQATLIPWLLIFANMMYMLSKFPWWLTPFSNTFGLLFAKLGGCNVAFLAILYPEKEGPPKPPSDLFSPEHLKSVSEKINNLLPTPTISQADINNSKKVISMMIQNPSQFLEVFKPEKVDSVIDKIIVQFPNVPKEQFTKEFNHVISLLKSGIQPAPSSEQRQINTSLHYVYSDPALLINKFTMANFDETIKKLNHVVDESKVKEIAKFKQFVKLKEVIAEWIWYLLTASITVSVSYNTLMSSKCTKTAEQYIDKHNKDAANTPAPAVTPTVYTMS